MLAFAAYGREALGDPPILRTRSSQFTLLKTVRLLPPLAIPRIDGNAADFGSLRGKVLLVNFWATWCPPCVEEMPALDRLQDALGGSEFQAVAIAMDRDVGATIAPFFRAMNIRHLTPFFDSANRIGYMNARNANDAPLALYGLPISYVVDRQGYVRGYVTGAVDWQSADARALLGYYLRDA
jgi:thiol-disulfide isomerase/thioredoxin